MTYQTLLPWIGKSQTYMWVDSFLHQTGTWRGHLKLLTVYKRETKHRRCDKLAWESKDPEQILQTPYKIWKTFPTLNDI